MCIKYIRLVELFIVKEIM